MSQLKSLNLMFCHNSAIMQEAEWLIIVRSLADIGSQILESGCG